MIKKKARAMIISIFFFIVIYRLGKISVGILRKAFKIFFFAFIQ